MINESDRRFLLLLSLAYAIMIRIALCDDSDEIRGRGDGVKIVFLSSYPQVVFSVCLINKLLKNIAFSADS